MKLAHSSDPVSIEANIRKFKVLIFKKILLLFSQAHDITSIRVRAISFPVSLRNRLLSAGFEPVLSYTENIKHRITKKIPRILK